MIVANHRFGDTVAAILVVEMLNANRRQINVLLFICSASSIETEKDQRIKR